MLFLSLSAQATNLVTNGGFNATTSGAGQLGYNTNATGWTTSGYNFLFTPGSADTTGVTGQYGNLKLWGPNDEGFNNGLPATSPDGGNYVGADGAYEVGAITQTISGLTALQTYAVSFYWAAAQQSGFGCVSPANPGGCTTDLWQVSFGGQTKSTAVGSTGPNQGGFSGWNFQTFTFTADGTSDLLSFLAVGTPAGEPPFALLDGVSVVATPEPGTFTMIGLSLIAVACFLRWHRIRQRRTAKLSAAQKQIDFGLTPNSQAAK
jgi:hypothetical protein